MTEIPYDRVVFCSPGERISDVAGRAPLALDPLGPLNLDQLEVEDLHRVVSWLSVTTAAETKAGLISAIKNHLGIT